MKRDANSLLTSALVEEWVRQGVRHAVASPGSRSTPLALSLAEHEAMCLHVHLDERSAGFFGLGLAKATGAPSVVLSTSGTAAANFHPAVLEAHHGRVPLIVCTSDRPAELRDIGAGQTVDQLKLYGDAVRWFFQADPPGERCDLKMWRWLAARSVAESSSVRPGPVHLNLPFREPLVPLDGMAAVPRAGSGGAPGARLTAPGPLPGEAAVRSLLQRVRAKPRGVISAGWGAGVDESTLDRFARAAGWPVLADAISGLRAGPMAVSTYDALARVAGVSRRLRPDVVLRIGGPLTSKEASAWLASSDACLVDPSMSWLDPHRAASEVLAVEAAPLLEAVAERLEPRTGSEWLSMWTEAEKTARRSLDSYLDSLEEPFEGRVARDVMAALPDGSRLVVASSMPVRDLESFAAPRSGIDVLANRGANGIDGFVSTVMGVAAASSGGATVGLLGDLCLLHDSNGLLGSKNRNLDAVLVVLDNDGGGIFSFLPQARLGDRFEELFGTPHGLELERLAYLHELPMRTVGLAEEVTPAVQEELGAGGVRLVRVRTERSSNVALHREALGRVAYALSGLRL